MTWTSAAITPGRTCAACMSMKPRATGPCSAAASRGERTWTPDIRRSRSGPALSRADIRPGDCRNPYQGGVASSEPHVQHHGDGMVHDLARRAPEPLDEIAEFDIGVARHAHRRAGEGAQLLEGPAGGGGAVEREIRLGP